MPLAALRQQGGQGGARHAAAAPSPPSLRRGERIFGGPLFFDYSNLTAPGVPVDGVPAATSKPLIPRPPKGRRAGGGLDGERLRVAPLQVRSVRLSFVEGRGGGAAAV